MSSAKPPRLLFTRVSQRSTGEELTDSSTAFLDPCPTITIQDMNV